MSFESDGIQCLATAGDIPSASARSRMPSGVSLQPETYPLHPLCIHSLSRMPSGVSQQPETYPLDPLSPSHAVRCLATAEEIPSASALSLACRPVSRNSRRHTLCICPLSHAVRCHGTAEDIPCASEGMYVFKRTMHWLPYKSGLDVGTLLWDLQ